MMMGTIVRILTAIDRFFPGLCDGYYGCLLDAGIREKDSWAAEVRHLGIVISGNPLFQIKGITGSGLEAFRPGRDCCG
jgi:hypothetical protein